MGADTFTLEAVDGRARAGSLTTVHGEISTPAFMPVGTKASIKALHPDRVRAAGADIVLANTYHLYFRPGADVIESLGGLHQFMGWDGPILTDSGGFQVFSLRDTILGLDSHGVSFRSVYDGDRATFTPESVAETQRRLGSDIAMCLDVCPPADCTRADLERAVSVTSRWAARQQASQRANGQLLFGISQGGADPELRKRSIGEIVELEFDGNALGGLSVGEERSLLFDTVEWAAPMLPPDKPRYFMGIGDPVGMLEVIDRGIDMFDSVLPTRMGRTGTALTRTGRLNMRNARFARDEMPLDEECSCAACERFSRGYLRHLVMQEETLALMLLSEHNVTFLLDLAASARSAIRRGEFAAFKAATLARLSDGPVDQEVPKWATHSSS